MQQVSGDVLLIGEKNSQRLALAKDLSREEKRAVFDMVRCGGFSLRQVARRFGITEVDAMDAFLDHLERWHNREVDLSIKQPVRSVPGFLGVTGAETTPVAYPVQRPVAPDRTLAKPIPRAFLPVSPVQLEGIGLVQSAGTFYGSAHNHLQNQQVNWRKLVGVEPRYGTPDQSDQSLTSHTLGQEAAEVNAVGTERTEFESAVKGIGLALALGAAFWLVILWRVM